MQLHMIRPFSPLCQKGAFACQAKSMIGGNPGGAREVAGILKSIPQRAGKPEPRIAVT